MGSAVHKAESFNLKVNKTLIFFIIGLFAIQKGIEATDVTTPCQPFSSLFLWHIGTGENELFSIQKRLLVLSIETVPERTNVSIVTFGTDNSLSLNFTKQAGHTNWRDTILDYKPGNALHYAIFKEIIQEIANHFKSSNSRAEIIYILVNNKTEIYDTENDSEKLQRKKTFVILSGIQAMKKTKVWLKLTTNEHHFVEFHRNEDIKKTLETISFLSCQDSMYFCDTDMYWWYEKRRCNSCTYICSKSCTAKSKFCSQACPYFHQCQSGTDITNGTDEIRETFHENIGYVVFANLGLIVIIVVIGILVIFVSYKKRSTFIKCTNFFRRSVTEKSIPFSPGVEDKGLGDGTYIFHQNDVPTNEQANLIHSKMERSSYSVSDMELKVFS